MRKSIWPIDQGTRFVLDNLSHLVEPLYQPHDMSHDFQHARRVCDTTLRLSAAYDIDPDEGIIAAISALCHDIIQNKGSKGKDVEQSAQLARVFIKEVYSSEVWAGRVCDTIIHASYEFFRPGQEHFPAVYLLHDADLLDCIGYVGIARTFAYGGRRNVDMVGTVTHIHEKLQHIQSQLHFPASQKVATQRHKRMMQFTEELYKEAHLLDMDGFLPV